MKSNTVGKGGCMRRELRNHRAVWRETCCNWTGVHPGTERPLVSAGPRHSVAPKAACASHQTEL